jgi:hypothetical protein
VPTRIVFVPSVDHGTNVDSYVLEVVSGGTSPVTVAQQNIGLPAIVDGECTADVGALVRQLPPGTYVGLIRAVNAYGSSSPAVSEPFSF